MPINSFFTRRPLSPVRASPRPTNQELAAEMTALALRCRAAGYDTAAYLIETAAFVAKEGYWPAREGESQ